MAPAAPTWATGAVRRGEAGRVHDSPVPTWRQFLENVVMIVENNMICSYFQKNSWLILSLAIITSV